MKPYRQLFTMSVAILLCVLVYRMPIELLACIGKIIMYLLAAVGAILLTNVDTLVRINKQVMEEDNKVE